MALSEYEVRKAKAQTLKNNGITAYAPKFKKKQLVSEILENHEWRHSLGLLRDIDTILQWPEREISTAWRLTLYRSHGKLAFWRLLDESWEIQIMFHKDACGYLDNRFPHKVNSEHISQNPNDKHLWRHVVKMVIVDDEGNIAVSHAGVSNNYSLPGGWVDEGDHFYDAVHREAIEETGTPVKILAELPKVHEYLKKRDRHQLVYWFLCKTNGLKGEPQFIESEVLDGFAIERMPLETLESHLQSQIANHDNNHEWVEIDGIFKRDLIILQAAKDILHKTVQQHNHESIADIEEVSNDILIDDKHLTPFQFLERYIDVGDFIGIKWEIFTTHKWEPTIFVSQFQLLSKALRPLGDKFHGIWDDQENAYRQRYLDMIFNRSTLERMKLRSSFVKALRDFYHHEGFIELETPILGTAASGAAAKPFTTHHNDFGLDMYLRIAPEIALKKATVGMLEKVFEIGKDFRNEWSDPSHHQEFSVAEHYAAYRNYEDNMKFTEDMFDYLFDNVPWLTRKVMVADKQWITKEVDFTTPWQRIDYIAQIRKDSWIDVNQYWSSDEQKLRSDIKAGWHIWEWIDTQTTTTMIDYLYKKVTRPHITGPAFIYNYPKTMQPLARASDANNAIVEQFQLLVNGWELIKAYSELVDPVEQQSNFDAQADALAKGDDEATKWDPDFVLAMEYGMPPQSWWGMGIDRIFSILTEQSNLRDVILFPMMKPQLVSSYELQVTSDNNRNSEWNNIVVPPLPTIDQAEALAQHYLNDTLRHCQQVGKVMKYFAKKLWQDEHYWYVVGLLHDIDRDHIGKIGDQHMKDEFDKIIASLWLTDDSQLKADIHAHAPFLTGVEPSTLIQKYIISIDELSGLIHAYSLMRPEWLENMVRSSLNKKIKDKAFAAWVDREHVKNCETYLWIPLAEFAMEVVEAMRSDAS
jgi:lysyl-tRNA synthetase, class II